MMLDLKTPPSLRFCVLVLSILVVTKSRTLAQQIDYPWNPNVDETPVIGGSDLLGLLSVFGSDFAPDPIVVDSLPLEDYLAYILDQIEAIPHPDCDPCQGQTQLPYDGHVYPLVPIDCDCWFAENLATDQYANGTPILHASEADWEGGDPWQVHVNDNPIDGTFYGRLYSSAARSDERNICPSGWRVPLSIDAGNLAPGGNNWSSTYTLADFAAETDPHTGVRPWQEIDPTNTYGFNLLPIGDFNLLNEQSASSNALLGMKNGLFGWSTEYSETGGFTISTGSLNSSAHPVRCVKLQDNDVGCTDPAYTNFNPLVDVDDGSCEDLLVLGCMDSEANNFNPSANVDAGNCVYGSALPACNGVESITFAGKAYGTHEIAGNCWFAEDLQSTAFANGDSIPSDLWMPGGSSLLDVDLQGYRYAFGALNDERGLCPSGWHISTRENWDALAMHFHGYAQLWRFILDPGESTQAQSVWSPFNNGDYANISGTSGLRFLPNISSNNGVWYCNEGEYIHINEGSALRPFPADTSQYSNPDYALAVRCIKD